jgi:nucleoside-diphosphate-sugar epimerase
MTSSKILVTGGTGFIGTRYCERLSLHYRLPYRALVRNFSHANRIARLGAEMVAGDLTKPESIQGALAGCDTVVHLAHSSDEAAPAETRNLMAACLKAGIKRLVHISSMSVHGEQPGPECTHEETATISRYQDPYCNSKAEVEEIVAEESRKHGLPTAILRPTIVYGPYGPIVMGIIAAARSGILGLIDDGKYPCNAVFVDDLCDAIQQALTGDAALGKPCFITSGEPVTWKDFNLAFARMVDPEPKVVSISSVDANASLDAQRPTLKRNLSSAAKLALSPDLHKLLSRVPALQSTIVSSKRLVLRNVSKDKILQLKSRMRTAPAVSGLGGVAMPNRGRMIRECFPIVFSNERARKLLAWTPRYNLEAGAAATRQWLEFAQVLREPDMLL